MFWLLMATSEENLNESTETQKDSILFLVWAQVWEMSNIQCRIVIPQVLDENRILFLNLSQHGLQIASDIWLIIKE